MSLLVIQLSLPVALRAQTGSSPVIIEAPGQGRIEPEEGRFRSLITLQDWLAWGFAGAIVVGVVLLILSGLLYFTSAQNQTRQTTAVNVFMFAIFLASIAGLAFALISIVQNVRIS